MTKLVIFVPTSIIIIIIYSLNVVPSQNRRIVSVENVSSNDENIPRVTNTAKRSGTYPKAELLPPPGMAK